MYGCDLIVHGFMYTRNDFCNRGQANFRKTAFQGRKHGTMAVKTTLHLLDGAVGHTHAANRTNSSAERNSFPHSNIIIIINIISSEPNDNCDHERKIPMTN